MGPLRSYVPNRHVAGHFTVTFLLAEIVIGISVFSKGFDSVIFNTIQAMDPFIRQFGSYNPAKDEYEIGSTPLAFLNSFPLLTYSAGLFLAMSVGEKYGRKPVLAAMQLFAFAGITVTYTARSYGQILAGRCLVQAYVGMEEWLVPMLQAELVPGAIRGMMVTTFVFEHQFASFICSTITYFTSQSEDNTAWTLPVALMYIFPALFLTLQWLVPESPRWLLRQGRYADAVSSLEYLYGCNADYSAAEEARLLHVSLGESDKVGKGSWADLFRGTNCRRTLVAMTANALSMLSGSAFTGSYGTVFLRQLGSINAFAGTMIKKAVVMNGPVTTIFLVERLGRRRLYMLFGSFTALFLTIMGSVGTTQPPTTTTKKVIVAMTMLYPYSRMVSFGPIATLLAAEVPSPRLRDKTSFVAWMTQNVFDFLTSFTLPYLLNAPYAHLESRVGFIYGGLCVLGVLWAFFCMPELRGRSLEETEDMWVQKVPARKMRTWVNADENSTGAMVTRLENETAGGTRHRGSKTAIATAITYGGSRASDSRA